MQWLLIPILILVFAAVTGTELLSVRFIRFIAYVFLLFLSWSVLPDGFFVALAYTCIHVVTSPVLHSGLVSTKHFLLNYGMMVATFLAIVWLFWRALEVLRKPVPELISILGVDVPDSPDLTLAGIRCDAATLTWAPPPTNRPVDRFVIEVNGVVVGETPSQETAITVTGLKPSHFYNLRVIAVSPNNFRAGSRVIRIETHAADGRANVDPRLVPDNYFAGRRRPRQNTQTSRENGEPKGPAIESANLADTGLGPPREAGTSSRRGTIGRKHSPSTTSMEPPPPIKEVSEEEENKDKSVTELTAQLDAVGRSIEEVAEAIAAEEEEHRLAIKELQKQKEEHQKLLKERSETSRKLKSDMSKSEAAAQDSHKSMINKRRTLEKEKLEKSRMEERIKKMDESVEQMRRDRGRFDEERKKLQQMHDERMRSLQEINESQRAECARLEKELKEKREKVKALENESKKLPMGKDDVAWRERAQHAKIEADRSVARLQAELTKEIRRTRDLDRTLMQMQSQPQPPIAFYNQGNSSGVDFDIAQNQVKRRSRTATSLSGVTVTSPTSFNPNDQAYSGPGSFSGTMVTSGPPGLQQYVEVPSFIPLESSLDHGYNEADIPNLSGEPPLSPGAAAFLPQGIFNDDDHHLEPPAEISQSSPFASHARIEAEIDPQSPASSGHSMPFLSSPRGSSNNIAYPQYTAEERTSNLSLLSSSPAAAPARTHGLTSIFSGWPRRGGKSADDAGPLLGSLKAGQSQSFPRQGDDAEISRRRISLTSWNMFSHRNSAGPDLIEGGMAPPTRTIFTPFTSSVAGFRSSDDPSSPRPASMASSDIPRPSTESAAIWVPTGFSDINNRSRVWGQSRAQSRRTSVHGAPTTNLASEDDIILDKEDLQNPQTSPSQVGVIGSRPAKSKPRLNPTAPSFMQGILSRSKGDKEEKDKELDGNARAKSKVKEKKEKKDKKTKGKEMFTLSPDPPSSPPGTEDSPTDPRKSRDGLSVGTGTSVSMSESHESLALDLASSNTPSEANAISPAAAAVRENVVQKLFRKGSTGKFMFKKDSSLSLSDKLRKDSNPALSIFKKGPSSVATNGSERANRSSVSISETDDPDEVAAATLFGNVGKGFDSATSSPNLGAAKNRDGRMSWTMFGRKKGKEKESFEIDQEQEAE